MWNPVPWFVEGGDHPPEVARLMSHVATSGAEGVAESTDCKVVPLAVPGAGVQILPGAATIPNRSVGVKRQSYLAQSSAAETVALNPTGSGAARSDLIIGRVEDPEFAGWSAPSDPAVGPYMFTRVIEGVPANTTRVQQLAGHANDSAVTLAIVTRPASTGTVLASHIKDLRKIAQSRIEPKTFMTGMAGAPFPVINVEFPNWGAYLNVPVDIPDWATHFSAVLTVAGLQTGGPTSGGIAVVLGHNLPGEIVGAATQFDENSGASASNPQRFMQMCAVSGKLAGGYAGTTKNLTFIATIFPGSYAVNLDGSTTVVIQYEFHRDVV